MTTLVISDVVKEYDGRRVLDGVSLTAGAGESLAIVGPSGTGKSTLLNLIGALDTPTSGTLRLDDIDIAALAGTALAAYRATKVGFVFQEHHLLPQLTALENVLLPTLAAGTAGAEATGRALLERMGLTERIDAFPAQMSGGERQRVAVARALINGAGVLLCDEPTGNLDRHSGAAVADLLLQVAGDGVLVLMVTHNHELAARFSAVLELRGGALTAHEDLP